MHVQVQLLATWLNVALFIYYNTDTLSKSIFLSTNSASRLFYSNLEELLFTADWELAILIVSLHVAGGGGGGGGGMPLMFPSRSTTAKMMVKLMSMGYREVSAVHGPPHQGKTHKTREPGYNMC